MKTIAQYRQGATGAIIDEYERALSELAAILKPLTEAQYVQIIDTNTDDEDCRSIQTIVSHVVRSGYGYANYIRTQFGNLPAEVNPTPAHNNIPDGIAALTTMLQYTETTLQSLWNITFGEILNNTFKTRWAQVYDMEQLLEHAIVHVLRHRRQIEKFILLIPNPAKPAE